METQTAASAYNSVQAIVLPPTERQSTRMKKLRFLEAFLEAFKATYGNVSLAARYAHVHRDTYYEWVKNDPEFKDRKYYAMQT